ncbi:hypothetical protein MATL_G00158130 [Megalops atlanticus]|uniref:Uncharacterized protein n=1 Tax=Megalops atlanticus TaxID=7932 RepID=A0A9D3PST4_MEGAT|nr:hypothetical protein MATL_G00158130 [Megalops atlanticus]
MIPNIVLLLLSITAAGCVPVALKPASAKFSSKNMMTAIVWEPASGSSNETLYQVEFKEYGPSKWKTKKECWNISTTFCDITMNVKHLMNRLCGRVRAVTPSSSSDWVLTKMFIPLSNMTFDPPRLHLVPETDLLFVHIHSWIENSTAIKEIEYEIKVKMKTGMVISIKNTTQNTEAISALDPGKEYCVSVISKIWIEKEKAVKKSEPGESCAWTKTDQRHMQLVTHIALGLTMTPLLICALLLYLWGYKSIYRPKAALPLNLVFTVEERKTLQSKSYIDLKEYDSDSMGAAHGNDIHVKAKANHYVRLPRKTLLSEASIVSDTDVCPVEFPNPPLLQEGVCHTWEYAPQSWEDPQPEPSYGTVQCGPRYQNTGYSGVDTPHDYRNMPNVHQLSAAGVDLNTGHKLALGLEPLYTNAVHHSE